MMSLPRAIAALSLLAGTAAACPGPEPSDRRVAFSGNDPGAIVSFDVTAGGPVQLSACPGYGHLAEGIRVPARPTLSVDLGAAAPHGLDIRVIGRCDSTLLVEGGAVDGYFDDDDLGNLDPRITLAPVPGGRLNIWVGAHDGPCAARLEVEAIEK